MTTPTFISNMALDLVPSAHITDLGEATLQAKLCARHYPQALGELLELTDWGVGVTRTTLAETTNDRPEEWAHAYARPGDAALVVSLLASAGSGFSTSLITGPYDRSLVPEVPFADYGGKLYSNMPTAQVDYIGQIAVADMSFLMRKALATILAAKIVLPITRDEKKKRLREEDAELAIQAAVAANFNRQKNTYGDFVPDVLAARSGYLG